MSAVELSLVVPVCNEGANIDGLVAEIAAALKDRSYEMIFVDDGSRDDTRARLIALKATHPALRVLGHRANAGQSRAIRTGVQAARANIVATLDGDGQNDPADLPRLVGQLIRPDAPEGLGLVQGRRLKRQDSFAKKIASRVANAVRQFYLQDGAEDSGCGIKAFRRDYYLNLPYFDHMHRYMPAIFIADGHKVEFCGVNHRPRGAGKSNYTNFGRLAVAFSDMQGVMWLRKRRRNPKGADEL